MGIGLIIGLSAIGVRSLHQLQTQYSVMQFLPAHHPALETEKKVRDQFHLSDLPTFIGLIQLKNSEQGNWLQLDRMTQLSGATARLKDIPGVSEALSIATVDGATDVHGVLNVGSLVEMTPPAMWNQRILGDQLLSPGLVSKDARTVMVYVQLQNANVDLLVSFENQFRKTLSESFPNSQVSIGGVPAVQTDLGLLLDKELRNFLVLTVVICALTLFLIFQGLATMLIPLVLTAFANIMVLAVMAWTGLTFTVLSTTMPVIIFITVVSLTTHTLLKVNENFEDSREVQSKWKLILKSNKEIWLPNLLGALTTCVGFLTLMLGKVPLIRDYGLSVALAVMVSWLLTSLGIIPFLVLLPRPVPRAWVRRPARWALWAIENKKAIVISVTAACVLMTYVGRHLNWTGRLFDDLPEGQEARQATEKIDSAMGGVIPLELIVNTDRDKSWSDPEQIKRLDRFSQEVRQVAGVGSVHSLPDFLRAVDQKKGSALPSTAGGIAEIYFLYSLSTNNILSQYMTPDGRSARVELKVHDLPSNQMRDLIAHLDLMAKTSFPDAKINLGGMGSVVHLIHDELSTELIFGFWQALLLIVVLLAFIFRSVRWALVAILPNLVPPIALLGYLAVTGTAIKPGVAIIFSIALGLAFNNTVYLLNRIKAMSEAEKRKQRNLPIRRSFYLEGNPCLVSTLIVMTGFSVFLFSYFSLNQTFGACMIVSIFAGMLGDLIFLPALLAQFPWLLGQKSPAFFQARRRELLSRQRRIDLDVSEV